MKKIIALILSVLTVATVFVGCTAKSEPFAEKSYSSKDEKITELCVDVRDRQIEVTESADEQIHIDYYENSKETLDISVSDGVLNVKSVVNKEWKDFVGGKASAENRKIFVQVPNELLKSLKITTTNEDITVAPLEFAEDVVLNNNGGNISFKAVEAGNSITLDVKNGDIAGDIAGSYDDYAITCNIKKGETNLPLDKRNGGKKLNVTANNGDVTVEIK